MTSDTTDADDTILIGLSRRFLALDGALRLYDRHRVRRDDGHLQQTRDEWQRTLDAITPIRAETEAGRVAKIHAARAAMRHGKDAAALVEAALDGFVEKHPFAAEPLRPADIAAFEQTTAAIAAVGTITIEIPRRMILSDRREYVSPVVDIRLA